MFTYRTLTTQQYVNTVVDVISKTEGHLSQVTDLKDGMSTIGYGYTFERNDNIALWQAAGITLTTGEWTILQQIDSASSAQKTVIALTQFGKTLTHSEAKALLEQTYQKYESPADELAMPLSWERVALVSVTYNRGEPAVHSKMQDFYSAIETGDRAEAWFQIRYNAQTSNPTYANGIAKRRYYESEVFGLYGDAVLDESQAKQIYAMYNRHHDAILDYEATYSSQIGKANKDFGLMGGSTVKTLETSLQEAAALLKQLYVPEALRSTINPLDIQLATDQQTDLSGDRRDGYQNNTGQEQNDLLIGNEQSNVLNGLGGNDILVGDAGVDTLTGGTGNDTLIGGEGSDTYIYTQGDGVDTIIDSDGSGQIVWDLVNIQGDGGTLSDKWKKFNPNVWQDQRNPQDPISYDLQTETDGSQTLYIIKSGDVLKVDNWQPGDLGISLGAGAQPPAPLHTYNGDQRAPITVNNGKETYDWSATSWAADGTLTGGVAEENFNDVLVGTSDADSINGLGGNDALDGGAGNDQIDGGEGDDLIAGGTGSDIIHGGAGSDEILSATGLNTPQRKGPNDVWQVPAGKTVWTQGSTWGIANNPNNTYTIYGGGSLTLDNAPDVIYGDAGDDHISGGHGDDYIDGGTGDDERHRKRYHCHRQRRLAA